MGNAGGGGGYTLSGLRPNAQTDATALPHASPKTPTASMDQLKPEPPFGQREGVCEAQIRSKDGTARRRFDIHEATLSDLFLFASTITSSRSFRLVTRFPRRTF